jgi:hypothetical protein
LVMNSASTSAMRRILSADSGCSCTNRVARDVEAGKLSRSSANLVPRLKSLQSRTESRAHIALPITRRSSW